MSDNTLRDLLSLGYEGHASSLKSGDAFAARYHDRVASKVRRRRAVRHTAIATGTLGLVALAAVGAQAAIGRLDVDPAVSVGPSPSPSPVPSPSASPSPSPTPSYEGESDGFVLHPLPREAAPGVMTEDAMLRLVEDATAPASPGAPSGTVACGDAVTGTYIDPFFDDATARILRPDTLYPTFLDPSYEWGKDDALYVNPWFLNANGDVNSTWAQPVEAFFVAVSYRSEAAQRAWVYDPDTDTTTGGFSVEYAVVSRQGDLSEAYSFKFATNDVDLAFGTVLVQDGVIVGHADFFHEVPDGTADPVEEGTFLYPFGFAELTTDDWTAQQLYDFGVGPLEHVTWCGDQPSGPVDAYAVIGSRPFEQVELAYSFIWAGQVEYK